MRSKQHVDELLKAAKILAVAEGETVLAYLIEMAVLQNAQNLAETRKPAATSKAA
ncbi:hypothetical protein [Pararhizobium qamdonense]|uniref:hypothetical protein n=1 Tax=Pararhizobium qamdonense TaxID=3031126 RepID=UPI0023E2F01F|nr:hypothetical protein [Pararhizobium qamdonense]